MQAIRNSALRHSFIAVVAWLVSVLIVGQHQAFATSAPSAAQSDYQWHISPLNVNLLPADTQPLQILDASARELRGASWRSSDSTLAEITVDPDGDVLLNAKAPGTVTVIASIGGIDLQTDIKIWAGEKLPDWTPKWTLQPLGRSLELLPAFPTGTEPSVDIYSLEQDAHNTYVRGVSEKGIQRSVWTLNDFTGKVKIICGDNLGGLLISTDGPDSYIVYSVQPEGKLRWKRAFKGIRKGYALSAEGLLHLINQSPDGKSATVSAWDEETGDPRFELPIPGSQEREVNLQSTPGALLCVPGRSVTNSFAFITSDMFINTDGDAYTAFTINQSTIEADHCMAGPMVTAQGIYYSAEENLVLWRIHPDGTYQSTVIDKVLVDRAAAGASFQMISPTGGIIPDGFGGVLLSVRSVPVEVLRNINIPPSESIYRITPEGGVAYKFPLPGYQGPIHDGMVLGEDNTGFVTRGGFVIKFDVSTGAELWRRQLEGSAEIVAALANGGVMVKLRTGKSVRVDPPEKK